MDLAIQNFRGIRKVNPVVGVVSGAFGRYLPQYRAVLYRKRQQRRYLYGGWFVIGGV